MKVYSTNGENYSCDTAEEAGWEVAESMENVKVGDTFFVHEADRKTHDIKKWMPNIGEHISEIAYERVGEFSEDWPPFSSGQDVEFERYMQACAENWLEANDLLPNFYGVENVKEVRVKIVNKFCECEVAD